MRLSPSVMVLAIVRRNEPVFSKSSNHLLSTGTVNAYDQPSASPNSSFASADLVRPSDYVTVGYSPLVSSAANAERCSSVIATETAPFPDFTTHVNAKRPTASVASEDAWTRDDRPSDVEVRQRRSPCCALVSSQTAAEASVSNKAALNTGLIQDVVLIQATPRLPHRNRTTADARGELAFWLSRHGRISDPLSRTKIP